LWPFLHIKGKKHKDMKFSESLKKNRDFQTVYHQGKSQANKYLIMYALQNAGTRNRLGISVSKKVGNKGKRCGKNESAFGKSEFKSPLYF
jgi:ribonuclease P protein component